MPYGIVSAIDPTQGSNCARRVAAKRRGCGRDRTDDPREARAIALPEGSATSPCLPRRCPAPHGPNPGRTLADSRRAGTWASRLAPLTRLLSWLEPSLARQFVGAPRASSRSQLFAASASMVVVINNNARIGRPFISLTYIENRHDQILDMSLLISFAQQLICINVLCSDNPTNYCYCGSEIISIKI